MTPGRPSHLGRSTLRQAVKRRDGSSTALVPLIWRHAFRLEQMPPDVLPMSAEAMARALRNLPALYGVDAVTVGADGAHLATSCWMAGQPSASVEEAWHAVRSRPLDLLPEPQSVKAAPPMALLVEVTARLRSVLGEQAGIALVLPDPTSLAASLGVPDATSWASRVLIEIVRSVGPVEPELVLFAGPRGAGPAGDSRRVPVLRRPGRPSRRGRPGHPGARRGAGSSTTRPSPTSPSGS